MRTLTRMALLLKIEGTAQGNDIEGTAEWTDDNGLHKYTFTGVLL